MTLYDLIMGNGLADFTRGDWAKLGRGEITDEDTIKQMLMDGYAAVVNE
jgi:hypothetical protein